MSKCWYFPECAGCGGTRAQNRCTDLGCNACCSVYVEDIPPTEYMSSTKSIPAIIISLILTITMFNCVVNFFLSHRDCRSSGGAVLSHRGWSVHNICSCLGVQKLEYIFTAILHARALVLRTRN